MSVKSESLSSKPALPATSTASTLILLWLPGRFGTNHEKPVPGGSLVATGFQVRPLSSDR